MGNWKNIALSSLLAAAAFFLFTGCATKANPLLLPEAELRPADVIVVLGFGPPVDENGKPVDELRRRVEKGVELYQAGLAPKMIVTGGNTYKDYYESAVMKELAVGMGVPADDVIEEREAMDTIGNARGSAKIMADNGWNSCILVSTPYHLKRGKKLFEAAGLEVQTAGCDVPDRPGYAIKLTVYEWLVRIDYAFIDEEALVRGEAGDKHTDRIKKSVRTKTRVTPDP